MIATLVPMESSLEVGEVNVDNYSSDRRSHGDIGDEII